MQLKVGDTAPAFAGQADDGRLLSLGELLAKGPLVLYFYPKDETMGCTAEACSFRDRWDPVQAENATVVGVSGDSVSSHSSFKSHHSLPFTLISDPDGVIRGAYGVKGRLIQPRVTFVIDEGGIIRHIYNSQMNATRHVDEALKALRDMKAATQSVDT
jgi:peroxiredoxin Q/BCP